MLLRVVFRPNPSGTCAWIGAGKTTARHSPPRTCALRGASSDGERDAHYSRAQARAVAPRGLFPEQALLCSRTVLVGELYLPPQLRHRNLCSSFSSCPFHHSPFALQDGQAGSAPAMRAASGKVPNPTTSRHSLSCAVDDSRAKSPKSNPAITCEGTPLRHGGIVPCILGDRHICSSPGCLTENMANEYKLPVSDGPSELGEYMSCSEVRIDCMPLCPLPATRLRQPPLVEELPLDGPAVDPDEPAHAYVREGVNHLVALCPADAKHLLDVPRPQPLGPVT